MIRVSTRNGVQTVARDEGDWLFERAGWSPWTATHVPTGTTLETGQTAIDDAKRVIRETVPDLCDGQQPTSSGHRYVVARGRQSAARTFAQDTTNAEPAGRGEPR